MAPRNSILSLFDPLASPVHSRDAPSPDSDKENSSPSPETDFIFGQAIKYHSPVVLKNRLIDVGDITVDDPEMNSMLTEEEALDESMCNEDDTFSFPQILATTPSCDTHRSISSVTQSNDIPRTPLAELSLDRDISPVARTKMYRRPLAFASSALPTSGESSSFTSVIDAVTASGESFAGPAHPFSDNDPANEIQSLSLSHETPQITINSVDDLCNSILTLSLDNAPATLSNDTFQPLCSPPPQSFDTCISHPRATLRPSPQTSSEDRNRHSIDLSTSFHLQLQSEEASFDLLKDKVSFFASIDGMEDDDSFDITEEEAKLQATVDRITETKTKVDGFCAMPSPVEKRDSMPTIGIAPQISSPQVPGSSKKVLMSPSVRSTPKSPCTPTLMKEGSAEAGKSLFSLFFILSLILASAATISIMATQPSVIPAPVFVPLTSKQSPVTIHTPAFQERMPVLPPPIPALKIVKRIIRPGHVKSESTSSVGSTVGEGSIKSSAVLSTAMLQHPRPISRQAAGNNINQFASNSSAEPTTSTSLRMGPGPRRVPAFDKQPNGTSNRRASMDQRSAPQNNSTGPRRILVAPSAPATNPAPAPASSKPPPVSGLKAPAKYGTGTSVSALPRPTSRLPTASVSGLARPRTVVGASVSGTGSAAVGNVKRAASVRRVV